MLTAISSAREVGADVILIDKDIEEIMYGIKSIPLREMLKLTISSLGVFTTNLDLKKVPPKKLIKQTIKYLKKDMPELYNVLIKSRNKHMIKQIIALKKDYKKIVVVVGAGHVDDLKSGIKCSSSVRKKSKT